MTLVTAMFTWQGVDDTGLESARVLLGEGGLRALGRMVRTPREGDAFTASYRLFVGEDGILSRLSVTSATGERERNLTLNRTEDGYWLLDTGSGKAGSRTEFGGALDVDLQFSPLYNALPIRRLGLHVGASGDVEHEIPMVFVMLPTLDVELVTQCYRTVSTLDQRERALIGFRGHDFTAEIEVDGSGMVTHYPELASRR
ncbi:putative glycolipid-binding domain-containing protein [Pseudonocardia eucalypti]|uniref:Glycolipid-binding domain-containing protein n=2 Tax=Pseudonocardia eucalypti TaxID=648755 RepID=A0ABP9PER7_9PSEU